MMGGVSPETCWAIKKCWNNKFYYTVTSCWFFLEGFIFIFLIHVCVQNMTGAAGIRDLVLVHTHRTRMLLMRSETQGRSSCKLVIKIVWCKQILKWLDGFHFHMSWRSNQHFSDCYIYIYIYILHLSSSCSRLYVGMPLDMGSEKIIICDNF